MPIDDDDDDGDDVESFSCKCIIVHFIIYEHDNILKLFAYNYITD